MSKSIFRFTYLSCSIFILLLFIFLFFTPASIQASQVYYVHSDHLGSTAVITNESGEEVQSDYYYPFGSSRSSSSPVADDSLPTSDSSLPTVHSSPITDHKYTSQISDEDQTGLYYYNARYYDPQIAKFTQADTMKDGFNGYSYVANNPINATDPTGNMTVEEFDPDVDDNQSVQVEQVSSGMFPFSGLTNKQMLALSIISTRYIANSMEDAIEIALSLDFRPGTSYEHPSNMCGPLSIQLLIDAGILPNTITNDIMWLYNPWTDVNNNRINKVFPESQFYTFDTNISTNKFDFKNNPLNVGDFIFLKSGSSDYGFSHMLVVTRIDEMNRIYSVNNVLQSDGTFKIQEVLLFDPNTNTGELINWANKRMTGMGGFILKRQETFTFSNQGFDEGTPDKNILDDLNEKYGFKWKIE